jgi:group I intron endonuclease
MKNVIYKIRNVVTNSFYVGSTIDARVRFQAHKRRLRVGKHQSPLLQKAWNEHGEDYFKFEVLEQLNAPEDLLAAEQVWLDEYAGKPCCYNWATDASAPMRGKTHTDETKVKLKEAAQKVPKGIKSVLHGVPRSEETKTRIGNTQRGVKKAIGRKVSPEGIVKIRVAARKGADSHFYGKRPTNADDLQRPIQAILPDGSTKTFNSLTEMRDTLGVAVGTIIRVCKSGKPIKFGALAGWVLSYTDGPQNVAPEIPEEFLDYPRTRQVAKELGAKMYFTGIPCDRNHISPRKVKGTCVACMKEDYKKDKRLKK